MLTHSNSNSSNNSTSHNNSNSSYNSFVDEDASAVAVVSELKEKTIYEKRNSLY